MADVETRLLESALSEVDAAADDDRDYKGQEHDRGEPVLSLVVRHGAGPDRER